MVRADADPAVTPSFRRLAQLIGDHEAALLDDLRLHFRVLNKVIPGSAPRAFVGPKRIRIGIAPDGIVVAYFPKKRAPDEFIAHPSDSVHELFEIWSERLTARDLDTPMDFEALIGPRDSKARGSEEDWRPKWQRLYVRSDRGARAWTKAHASWLAHEKYLDNVTSHLDKLPHLSRGAIDMVSAALEERADEIASQLNDGDRGSCLELIRKCPVLLRPDGVDTIVDLDLEEGGHVDFVVEITGDQFLFFQLGWPSQRLFRKSGDPTAALARSQATMARALQWVDGHPDAAGTPLKPFADIRGIVVLGRSSELDSGLRESLRRKNAELRRIDILTYDDMLDIARSYIRNLGRPNQGA